MSSLSKNTRLRTRPRPRLRIAVASIAVAVAGLAMAGPAAAATPQVSATASVTAENETVAVPTSFVDLPTTALASDAQPQEITLTYRNESTKPREVAPQLLLESPDQGPFLTPTDIKLEHRTPSGCWEPVELGTQTGTLFTDLVTSNRELAAGETLTETYRVTVTKAGVEGTVHPRVALFD
ncbi:signal peptide protein [Streptomyces sp. NPDC002643]